MGVNYFTDEQLRLLEENPYVVKASKKSITYSEELIIKMGCNQQRYLKNTDLIRTLWDQEDEIILQIV